MDARHVLGEADCFEAEGDGAEDDGLEGVGGVAGAEFARVGVHCEGHFGGRLRGEMRPLWWG